MYSFEEYINEKKLEYDEQFDSSDLVKEFIPFYESQERIEVDFGNGEIKRGRIGVTTGWKPAFLLMLKSNSTGSMYVINKDTKLLKVLP